METKSGKTLIYKNTKGSLQLTPSGVQQTNIACPSSFVTKDQQWRSHSFLFSSLESGSFCGKRLLFYKLFTISWHLWISHSYILLQSSQQKPWSLHFFFFQTVKYPCNEDRPWIHYKIYGGREDASGFSRRTKCSTCVTTITGSKVDSRVSNASFMITYPGWEFSEWWLIWFE